VSVVQEYWGGVRQRLQAEVDTFSRLIRHYGEQGRENEVALSRLLGALVPQRLGLGTGMLIDSKDNYSRQIDLIVYDRADEPAILAQTTQVLYPIENVSACIEVKTTLYARTVEDCVKNKKAVLELTPVRRYPDGSSHPIFVVLAYRTDISPQQIYKRFLASDQEHRPDLLCVLEHGILGCSGDFLSGAVGRDFQIGLALLPDRDGDSDAAYRRVDSSHKDRTVTINERVYPIVEYGDSYYVCDPARALLLFVESLLRRLTIQSNRTPPVLTHYLDASARELAWLPNQRGI
jgi:hypothetical protein